MVGAPSELVAEKVEAGDIEAEATHQPRAVDGDDVVDQTALAVCQADPQTSSGVHRPAETHIGDHLVAVEVACHCGPVTAMRDNRSSHTVWQIPVVRGYQTLWGSSAQGTMIDPDHLTSPGCSQRPQGRRRNPTCR